MLVTDLFSSSQWEYWCLIDWTITSLMMALSFDFSSLMKVNLLLQNQMEPNIAQNFQDSSGIHLPKFQGICTFLMDILRFQLSQFLIQTHPEVKSWLFIKICRSLLKMWFIYIKLLCNSSKSVIPLSSGQFSKGKWVQSSVAICSIHISSLTLNTYTLPWTNRQCSCFCACSFKFIVYRSIVTSVRR